MTIDHVHYLRSALRLTDSVTKRYTEHTIEYRLRSQVAKNLQDRTLNILITSYAGVIDGYRNIESFVIISQLI
jgi:purine nucleoside phosphorylase